VAPAKAAGLQPGDRITSVDGTPGDNYGKIQQLIRDAPAGVPVPVTFVRDGKQHTVQVILVPAQRPPVDDPAGDATQVSALGVAPQLPDPVIHYGPVAAIGGAGTFFGEMVQQTFSSISKFPEKVPKLLDALNGQPRDPETPISVVGASRIGGQAIELGSGLTFVMLLAGLNIFIGIFNLFPLLPLDGGHIAIIWFEKIRSWFANMRGRPDPGRVDYNKLLPVTYLVILVFGGLTLLTLAADFVNPISL
jgi:membrane-associated protease RseP (regulator of RpoE activity)